MENAPYCPPSQPQDEVQVKLEESPPEQLPATKITISKDTAEPRGFRRRTGATEKKTAPQLSSIQEGVPSRSLSVSYFAQPVPIRRRGDLRRKSISMIRKGHTGEEGSEVFKQALVKDAQHEIHPGWKSVRRVAGVLGYVPPNRCLGSMSHCIDSSFLFLFRKVQLLKNQVNETKPDSTDTSRELRLLQTPSPPARKPKRTLSQYAQTNTHSHVIGHMIVSLYNRGLIDKVDSKCTKQIKLLFDSIDTNGDGHLSVQELAVFASDLGYVCHMKGTVV